jgi:IS30 family transposase
MANQVSMAVVQSIETLRKRGTSRREIARLLGVHRETVGKYVARLENRPNAPPGSESGAGDDTEIGRPTPRADPPGPPSVCEPYRELIRQKLERRMSAQRIYQDLVAEQEFPATYDSVRSSWRSWCGPASCRCGGWRWSRVRRRRSISGRALRCGRRRGRSAGRGCSGSCSALRARRTASPSGSRARKPSWARWRMRSGNSAGFRRRW